MPKTLKNYTVAFKLQVVGKAEEVGNRAAGRLFQVDEKCVRRWRKDKGVLITMPKHNKTRRHGSAFWPTLEENLATWVKSQRAAGIPVSTVKIRLQARIMATQMGLQEFRGGPAWCYRFMKRKSLSVRVKTTVGQSLPPDWEEKMASFHKFVSEAIETKNYKASQIINMDEVPLSFDCPPNRTVHVKGEKAIAIKTTGNEKMHFTCVLACAANGDKLKPLLIFKRKTMPKENFPPGVAIRVNEKGWMSEELMQNWLDEVWRKRKGAFFKPDGLLIFDSMRAHVMASVKDACKKVSANLAVIPGGLTKKLQPLDLTVNSSFKNEMRKRWEMWMSEGIHSYTKTGRMKKATFSEVAQWVVRSWAAVKTSAIISGFETAGIVKNRSKDEKESNMETEDIDDVDNENLDHNILSLFHSESESSDFEGFAD